MPTKYIRQHGSSRGSWKEEDLIKAVNAVKERAMGINEASRYFKIPKTTLKRRINNKCYTKGPIGPSSVLGLENEKKMVVHIKKLQACGFSPNRDCVRSMAFKLAEQMRIKNNFDVEGQKAGYDWLKSFMDRHRSLSIRKSEGVSKNRALGMNRSVVKAYFDLLGVVMKENNLIDKPGNVFNMDETGLQLNNKPGEVIAARGSKSVNSITSGEKGETVTVVSCISGEGTYLPPYCIFKGKNKKAEYGDGMPPGSAIVMNEKSAYINSEVFFDWLKNHFVPRKPFGKVLLILDGHTSHCNSVEMLEFADSNEVILISLPSHTSHYLQPLDRSFFKSFKSNYYSTCNTFITNNPTRKITRLQFGKLLAEAWSKSATVENAVSGFKRCGIIPLDISAIPDYCFLTEPQQEQHTNNNQPETNVLDPLVEKEHVAEPGTSRLAGNNIQIEKTNLTPTKILNKISPVPILKKKITVRNVEANKPKVLTSADNIKKIVRAKEEKAEQLRLKEEKKKKRDIKKTLFPKKKNEFTNGIIYDDSSDGSAWEENQCVGCLEDYNSTTSKDDWIKCVSCGRWSHENCTKYGDICDYCGKKELKKKRLLKMK